VGQSATRTEKKCETETGFDSSPLVDSVDYIMGGRILVFLRGDMYIRDGSCSGIRKLVRAGGVGRGLIRQGKEKARALGSNCST